MPQHHGVDQERPNHELGAIGSCPWHKPANRYTKEQQSESCCKDRYPSISIEPSQFGIYSQISYFIHMTRVSVRACQPAMVGDSETFDLGGMKITGLVRDSMMSTMMSNPPQGATLRCASTEPCSDELGNSASFEGVVAKFSMIEAGNSEASHYVHHH
jgi:hypothetical protein